VQHDLVREGVVDIRALVAKAASVIHPERAPVAAADSLDYVV
jgi:hypothetical protein